MVETSTKVDPRIAAAEAEALLQDLVRIPSLSGAETEASDFLKDWMADHGFQAHVDESGSAVGERGTGQLGIVLLGHIDTFPGEIPVRVEGRRLYGRGSVDAKGALAAFAVAAAGITPLPGVRLVVIGATEEEAASSRGARHARDRYHPSACVIGEPSGWDRLTLGYKGRLNMAWAWSGALAHSAGPTRSAAEVAVDAWRSIEDYANAFNQGRVDVFQQLGATLLSVQSSGDGVMGRSVLEVNLRLPPGLNPLELEELLRTRTTLGETSFSGHEAAFQASNNNPLTRAMRSAIRANAGQPRHVHKTGTSDMNVVGPIWKCPIVAYGPGDSRLDHTPDEHVNLDEYLLSIQVLQTALETLMAGLTSAATTS
jgi:LysW-gamma-L-lysine carboxypeptidase